MQLNYLFEGVLQIVEEMYIREYYVDYCFKKKPKGTDDPLST